MHSARFSRTIHAANPSESGREISVGAPSPAARYAMRISFVSRSRIPMKKKSTSKILRHSRSTISKMCSGSSVARISRPIAWTVASSATRDARASLTAFTSSLARASAAAAKAAIRSTASAHARVGASASRTASSSTAAATMFPSSYRTVRPRRPRTPHAVSMPIVATTSAA